MTLVGGRPGQAVSRDSGGGGRSAPAPLKNLPKNASKAIAGNTEPTQESQREAARQQLERMRRQGTYTDNSPPSQAPRGSSSGGGGGVNLTPLDRNTVGTTPKNPSIYPTAPGGAMAGKNILLTPPGGSLSGVRFAQPDMESIQDMEARTRAEGLAALFDKPNQVKLTYTDQGTGERYSLAGGRAAHVPSHEDLVRENYPQNRGVEVEGVRYYGQPAASKLLELERQGKVSLTDQGIVSVTMQAQQSQEMSSRSASRRERPNLGIGIEGFEILDRLGRKEEGPEVKMGVGISGFSLLDNFSMNTPPGYEMVDMDSQSRLYTSGTQLLKEKNPDIGWPAKAPLKDVPLIGSSIRNLVEGRYQEVKSIEEQYQGKIQRGISKAEADKWKQAALEKSYSNIEVKIEEGLNPWTPSRSKTRYSQNSAVDFLTHVYKSDIPGIDVELGHKERTMLYGVPLMAGAVTTGGLTSFLGLDIMTSTTKTLESVGAPPIVSLVGGLAVGGAFFKAASVAKQYTPPVGLSMFDVPGLGKGGVFGVKGKALAGVRIVEGRGMKAFLGERGVGPLMLKEGEAISDQAMTTASRGGGTLQANLVVAAAKQTPEFIPTELTRLESGLDIMRKLEKQPSEWQNEFLAKHVKAFEYFTPEFKVKFFEVVERHKGNIVIKGSAGADEQLSPKVIPKSRNPVDVDFGTIDINPDIVKNDFFETLGSVSPTKIEGATVKSKSPFTGEWIKISDVVTRKQMLLENIIGPITESGEFRWGLSTMQKPYKTSTGKLIAPLSEQLIRKGSTSIDIQRRDNLYFLNPVEKGRVFKDIYDFQESVAPTLVESAKAHPTTFIKGFLAEKSLEKFKASRGEDITKPLPPRKEIGRIRNDEKLVMMRKEEPVDEFFIASKEAYKKLYKEKSSPKSSSLISAGYKATYPYSPSSSTITSKTSSLIGYPSSNSSYNKLLGSPYSPTSLTSSKYSPPYSPSIRSPPYSPPYSPSIKSPPYSPPYSPNPQYIPEVFPNAQPIPRGGIGGLDLGDGGKKKVWKAKKKTGSEKNVFGTAASLDYLLGTTKKGGKQWRAL